MMLKLKNLILEVASDGEAAEEFLKHLIRGSKWENKVFAAGGYVRDQIMGMTPKDLDVVVDYPDGGIEFAVWATKRMNNYKEGSNPVTYPRFGTAKFNLRGIEHNGVDLSHFEIESVMPRGEKYTAGSRKPETFFSGLQQDVERRDLTANSLLKNISTGEILDLTGMGKDDIKRGIIRTPLNPDKIFTDDPLRMLRAVRFAMKYNWDLPYFMLRGLKKNAAQLENISQERIRDELNKMLVTSSPDRAVKLLKVTGLLKYVIPELMPAVRMTQNKHHNQDVFSHILSVMAKTKPELKNRLMALFHDIGKTVTRSVTPTGVHFYGHEDEGAEMVKKIMTRLKYPSELIDAVELGVKNHMRLKGAGEEGVDISDKALRKFARAMGKELAAVLDLMHADNISHADASAMPKQIEGVRRRLDALSKEVDLKKPKLPVNGNDIKELGVPEGPMIGKAMSAVTEAWYENPKITREEALEIARKAVNG